MAEIPYSLLIFTYISGISIGTFLFYTILRFLYLRTNLLNKLQKNDGISVAIANISTKITVIAFVLLGISLLASATHLGHPFRFFNALVNPKSMISQEAYWSIAFGVFLLVVLIFTIKDKVISPVLYGITSMVGIGLLIVTSLVYTNVLGVPAWNHGITPILFFVSSLLMGSSVCLVLLSFQTAQLNNLRNIILIFAGILLLQILVVTAFYFHLSSAILAVELPRLLLIKVGRWVIGLLIPLIAVIILIKKTLEGKMGILLLFISVIIGEALSRFIFFMNGIHL